MLTVCFTATSVHFSWKQQCFCFRYSFYYLWF